MCIKQVAFGGMIDTKIIDKFMTACEKRIEQHKTMLVIVKDISSSSKQLSKSFGKLIKKIDKDTTLFTYSDAHNQLETRKFAAVGNFGKLFEKNMKDQQAILKQCRKPFEKQAKIYKSLDARAEKDKKALNKAEATVYEKNAAVLRNKNEKTDANLVAAQSKLQEAKKVFEASKSEHQKEIGNTQQVVNNTAKILSQVLQKLIQFEKLFYEKTSNMQEARAYFDRLTKVHQQIENMDPKSTVDAFEDSINLKSIIQAPVFKLMPADPIREAAAQKEQDKEAQIAQTVDAKVPEEKPADQETVLTKANGDGTSTEQLFQKETA